MAQLTEIASLLDLSAKVAIVIGGAEGMGKETSILLASAGAKVIVADINKPWADDTASDIESAGGEAIAYKVDLADEDSIIELMNGVRNDHGSIDILVNVAGLQDREFLESTSVELWDKLHRVNLRGPFIAVREASRIMRADGTKGRIVNISSIGSVTPVFEGLVAYNSTKAGINGLTRNSAHELAKDGITVNAVLPGNTTTSGQSRTPGPPVDMDKVSILSPPLGRAGKVSDIANAVLFLVSPMAEWVTGQEFIIDGGTMIR